MATATVAADAQSVVVRRPFWKRLGDMLKSAGSKAVGFIKRAANWLWNTKAVRWAATKSSWLINRLWYLAKGPVGWVAVGIGALLIAPKAIFIVFVAATLLLLFTLFAIHKLYQAMEREGVFDDNDPVEPITAGETIADRLDELQLRLNAAMDAGKDSTISDLTGRMFLLKVRSGLAPDASKLKADASTSDIHRNCKEHIAALPGNVDWDIRRMYDAIRNEDKRLKEIAKAKPTLASV